MRNNWDLLTETKANSKVLKIKKNNVEYKFEKKVSENANGGYLMEWKSYLTKSLKKKKKGTMKTTKISKKMKNEKKETLAQKSVQKST